MASVKPILRIFDYAKAVEFYCDWLGFRIDWEHRPAGSPGYLQVSRDDVTLHLSEHHGDSSPAARVFIDDFENLSAYPRAPTAPAVPTQPSRPRSAVLRPHGAGNDRHRPVPQSAYVCAARVAGRAVGGRQ